MRRFLSFLMIVGVSVQLWACTGPASGETSAATQEGLKVFISVDMEGIAGVVNGGETGSSGPDYQRARVLTTLEANAAVDGALAAGATEVVVRDGHGAKTNIIPELFHKDAKLLRGAGARTPRHPPPLRSYGFRRSEVRDMLGDLADVAGITPVRT